MNKTPYTDALTPPSPIRWERVPAGRVRVLRVDYPSDCGNESEIEQRGEKRLLRVPFPFRLRRRDFFE